MPLQFLSRSLFRTSATPLAAPVGRAGYGGILRDEGGRDGGLFKGILVRYLTLLATEPAVSAASWASYVRFLEFNGQSLYQRATRRPPFLFNTNWTSMPSPTVDSSTERSGVMLFEAPASLQARKLLSVAKPAK